MKFLTELMKVSRLSDDDNVQKDPVDDINGEQNSDDSFDDLVPQEGEADDELGDLEGNNELENGEPEDPNRAGVIRHVKGAHLVYKREQEDGTYEEMWIYNSGEFKRDISTKKAIIAGTDIPANGMRSPDGAQELKMWSAGNCDIVVITGLPQ